MTKEEENSIENEILHAIKKVRHGSVEIVIHDARVVQIEVREKVRLVNSAKQLSSPSE